MGYLGEPSEEVEWCGCPHIEVQHIEHDLLHAEDVFSLVGIIRDPDPVIDIWRSELFKLGGDEHGGDPNKLHAITRDCLAGQEHVHQAHTQEEGL